MIFRRKGKTLVGSEPIALDIETSWNNDNDNPKCWIVSIQVYFLRNYYFFRSPIELIKWYKALAERYQLSKDKILINIIHNASYDLSYLVPFFQELLPAEGIGGIYLDRNKILTYQQWCFEWRCTYRLTNMSLAKWSDEMSIEHKKKVGLYDYSAIHYQDDELDADSLDYDKYDVLALYECFMAQMEKHGDNIATIPLTSTGYSRRKFRDSAKKDAYYRDNYFFKNQLDVHAYNYCVNSFSGGFTHTNRHMREILITGDIGHRDFRSMYPSNMRDRLMAVGAPQMYYDINSEYDRAKGINIDKVISLYPNYTCITRIRFFAGTHLKSDDITFPFMQYSKRENESKDFSCLKDNGRICTIRSGWCDMYISTRTLMILNEQYHLEYTILGVIRFRNKPMPDCIAEVIDELFKNKSDYKIKAQALEDEFGLADDRTVDAYFLLQLNKALLNASFGMFATKPVRTKYELDYTRLLNDDEKDRDVFHRISNALDDKTKAEELAKYYNGKNNFLAYQIGIAITEESKYQLYRFLKAIGYDKALYCDTDSIFYLKDAETEKAIEELNAEYQKDAHYIINSKGEKVYYDVFESEPDLIAFKSLHAKCYGVVTKKKKEVQIVIAGVPARTLIGMDGDEPIYLTREEELSGITKEIKLKYKRHNKKVKNPVKVLDKLKTDTEFHVNTGSTSRYLYELPHEDVINGHKLVLAGGAIIQTPEVKRLRDIFDDET